MTSRSIHSAVVTIILAFSGASLAGKGGGGMGGPGHQRGGNMPSGQSVTTERRSDKALQQDRDQERYGGSGTDRDTQKAKAKGAEEGTGAGEQVHTLDQNQLRDQSSEN